ncbi:MAG: tetraacyldisaccharide 4'-kinase [Flammeovirgaceae bacterium]
MKTLLIILLYPFAILYNLITRFRNHLYNLALKPSIGFDLPVICVGNLTVGGTGKTPHIEYLTRLLKDQKKVATLSRGYGRKTRGFLLAEEAPNAESIGDEPMQFYQKYGKEVVVAVGEQRAFAIPSILQSHENTEVILLDDAFQHRKVRPSFTILLTDYNRPFYHDFLLPAGRLRESRIGASRADVIIVSKCPDRLLDEEKQQIEQQILRYAQADTPIFFTGIQYGEPVALTSATAQLEQVLLVTGIAKAGLFQQYVSKNFQLENHLELADHVTYSPSVVQKIRTNFDAIHQPNKVILTTEKDAVKLKAIPELAQLPIYYIPIEVYFLDGKGQQFNELIWGHCEG